MNYEKLVTVVAGILSHPEQEPLSFDELKKMVEKSGTVYHDKILEQVIEELRERKNVSFDRTTKGNLTNIRWK